MTTAGDRRAATLVALAVLATASCRKEGATAMPMRDEGSPADFDAAEAELARTAAALRQLGVGAAPKQPVVDENDGHGGGGGSEPPPVTSPPQQDPRPTATTEAEASTSNACHRICELADVACELEQRICTLADAHVGEARYENACYYARDQCELARDACADCDPDC